MGQDLITGGSGFIGSHMCGLLVVHNYQERVLDSSQWGMDAKGRPAYINSRVEHRPQRCFLIGRHREQAGSPPPHGLPACA